MMTPPFHRRVMLIDELSSSRADQLLQLEISDGINDLQHRNEQSTLYCMSAPKTGALKGAYYVSGADVVAVHGLGGDAYRSWQHENGFNWLQHLQERLPSIRVYSCAYDSGIAFSGGLKGLNDQARYLLNLIKSARSNEMVSTSGPEVLNSPLVLC
jgi:hypothetical protein